MSLAEYLHVSEYYDEENKKHPEYSMKPVRFERKTTAPERDCRMTFDRSISSCFSDTPIDKADLNTKVLSKAEFVVANQNGMETLIKSVTRDRASIQFVRGKSARLQYAVLNVSEWVDIAGAPLSRFCSSSRHGERPLCASLGPFCTLQRRRTRRRLLQQCCL